MKKIVRKFLSALSHSSSPLRTLIYAYSIDIYLSYFVLIQVVPLRVLHAVLLLLYTEFLRIRNTLEEKVVMRRGNSIIIVCRQLLSFSREYFSSFHPISLLYLTPGGPKNTIKSWRLKHLNGYEYLAILFAPSRQHFSVVVVVLLLKLRLSITRTILTTAHFHQCHCHHNHLTCH